MTIYEIDEALLDLVDPETGEVMDISAFESLAMEREKKLENMACWVKELYAEENALKNEEDALRARRAAARRKRERLTGYLETLLAGSGLKTPRVAVGYQRNPPHVEAKDEGAVIAWCRAHGREDLLRVTTEFNKAKAMTAIKGGDVIEGAEIVQDVRMVIR